MEAICVVRYLGAVYEYTHKSRDTLAAAAADDVHKTLEVICTSVCVCECV